MEGARACSNKGESSTDRVHGSQPHACTQAGIRASTTNPTQKLPHPTPGTKASRCVHDTGSSPMLRQQQPISHTRHYAQGLLPATPHAYCPPLMPPPPPHSTSISQGERPTTLPQQPTPAGAGGHPARQQAHALRGRQASDGKAPKTHTAVAEGQQEVTKLANTRPH